MMVFILVMSLHGLQSMITELLPEFSVGGLGVSIGPFWFVAMSVVLLFRSFWACLAIPVGGIVFGEILIGDFSALGAVEGLLVITASWFFAMSLITDPTDPKQIAGVGLLAKAMEETAAWFIDVGKFYIGVEELEAISWLPATVWATEGVGALIQIVVAGIVFGAIPTLFLYPRLRGKIEPLLGMRSVEGRDGSTVTSSSLKRLVAWVAILPLAFGAEALSETSGGIITFTPEFVETYGQTFLFVPIVVAAVIAFGLVAYRQRKVEGTGA
ncbi:hypothetical protein C475_03019 [Halosimplex carlsbadense 2-9-1]|uniref:DUF8171 domain-containing protein n=2 Tax=Halosimplex carlsbadense TaxID=171164 RepID=M0D4R3_9EURY|nr:hypothetical protein C475_03019 [Halosimplex carlsbadense 2-9-1]